MNREQARIKAPIMQAFADGKTIQTQKGTGEWEDLDNPSFCRDAEKYRIKPNPRKFIVWQHGDTLSATPPQDTRLSEMYQGFGWKKIPVTEDIS